MQTSISSAKLKGKVMINNIILLTVNMSAMIVLIMGAIRRDKWYVNHHAGLHRSNRTWRYSIRFGIGGLLVVAILDALKVLLGLDYEALLPWYVTGLGVWYSYYLYSMADIK